MEPLLDTRPPVTTSAYGWGPNGTLKPVTSTVHVPDCMPGRRSTASTLFRWSAAPAPPLGNERPGLNPVKLFPRYVVPSGAVTRRSRSFTRLTPENGAPG